MISSRHMTVLELHQLFVPWLMYPMQCSKGSNQQYKDTSRMDGDETYVQAVVNAIESWVHALELSNNLVIIFPGLIAPPQVTTDLLQAYEKGCESAWKFCNYRVSEATTGFFERIPKINLTTFTSPSLVRIVSVRVGVDNCLSTQTEVYFSRIVAMSTNRK